MQGRKLDDLEGMLVDIRDNLQNMSKGDLIDWIMELNFYNMEKEDLISDYKSFYGTIIE